MLCNSLSLTFFFHSLHLQWLRMLNYLFIVVKMIMQATGYQLVNWFAWYPFGCFFFHFLLHLQWLYSSVVCGFFIVACIISSNDFVSLLILNLRIKDSLINIRFRNYWFKCCLVQFIKHHKFFINLRHPIFINLL